MKVFEFEIDVGEGCVLAFHVDAESKEKARYELDRVRKKGKLFDPDKKTGNRIVRVDREADRKHTIYCEDTTLYGEIGVHN